jgi:hypothetical protein
MLTPFSVSGDLDAPDASLHGPFAAIQILDTCSVRSSGTESGRCATAGNPLGISLSNPYVQSYLLV